MHGSLKQDARLLGRGADVSFAHASELPARCAHAWEAFASGEILARRRTTQVEGLRAAGLCDFSALLWT